MAKEQVSFKNRDRFIQLGIAISSLRKLRGMSPLHLEEARRIQEALDCGLSLDALFARRDQAA